MAPKMKPFIRAEKHLILTAPDTEFEIFLSELDQLSEREPEILDKIEQDLEKYARNKKRLEDKRWQEARNPSLPHLPVEDEELKRTEAEIGCPRMSAFLVYLFMMIHLGSIKSQIDPNISFRVNHTASASCRERVQSLIMSMLSATRPDSFIFDAHGRFFG